MKKNGKAPGATQGGCYFLAHFARLSDTSNDDLTAAPKRLRHQVDCLLKAPGALRILLKPLPTLDDSGTLKLQDSNDLGHDIDRMAFHTFLFAPRFDKLQRAFYPLGTFAKELRMRKSQVFLLALTLLAPWAAWGESLGFDLSTITDKPQDLTVVISDDLTQAPLDDAEIIVADTLGDPAGRLVGRSDNAGAASFPLEAPKKPRTLTVSKKGYTVFSLIGFQTPYVSVSLKPLPPEEKPILGKGTLGPWTIDHGKNIASIGMAFPNLTPLGLLFFDQNSILSPTFDTIDAAGPREIPSNLVLPKQVLQYLFFNITVNKPEFHLPLQRSPNSQLRLASIRGQVPVSALVNSSGELELAGALPSRKILNAVRFTHAAVSAPIVPNGDFTQDTPPNVALTPKHKVSVAAPPFSGDVLVAAMTDLAGGQELLLPTDIKMANARAGRALKPIQLVGPTNSPAGQHVITAVLNEPGTLVSGILQHNVGTDISPGPFLPVSPIRRSRGLPERITLVAPDKGLGSAIFQTTYAAAPDHPFTSWQVFVLPAAGKVQFSTRLLPAPQTIRKLSIMKLEGRPDFSEQSLNGRELPKTIQRFTRATAFY